MSDQNTKSLPRAKKEFGQHFLRDQKVISGICSDWNEEADVIIEVGPGPAVLTEHLAKLGKPFHAIEKDESFSEYLLKFLDQEHIHFQDALKFNWSQFIADNNLSNKKIWLVSNLPYNVGTVLFTQFLQIPEIEYMTLMFQKEVGDKTYFKQLNSKSPYQMNGLFVLSNNYFESKQLLKVAPGAFTPPPKVDSVVVSYQRRSAPDISITDYPKLNKFTRGLFSMRRKQLGKVLKGMIHPFKPELLLAHCNIEKTRRAETLLYTEVIKLYHNLHDDPDKFR